MKTIFPVFSNHIKKNNLIRAGDSIIAAFSGGKDSVALLYLLKELQKTIDFKLVAAYFNHQIREDFRQESEWIENFCLSISVELIYQEKDVLNYKEKYKLNLENAASLLRYRFLKDTADKFKNAKIATGHTKSDLAETFFIKLFRGSGTQGLSSIYFKKDLNIIRPLLIFSTQDILDFLNRNHISHYRDYSNQDVYFQRNKIRHHLIPRIKEIEPNIEHHIFKTVRIIQCEHDYLQQQSQHFLDKNLMLEKILPLDKLKKCHIALQRFVLREYIKKIKGDLLNINFDHVEHIIGQFSQYSGMTIPELELKVHKGFIFPANIQIPAYSYPVPAPGTVKIKEIDKKLVVKKMDTFQKPKNEFEIIACPGPLAFPLEVRNPEKKDKYIKINSSIDQRVFEMIRSSGIPAELRNLCPVLISSEKKPIWVAGSPIADSFKVMNKTKNHYLKISLD